MDSFAAACWHVWSTVWSTQIYVFTQSLVELPNSPVCMIPLVCAFKNAQTRLARLAAVRAWVFVCRFTLPPALWVLRQAFCPGLPRVSTPLSTWWMDRAEKRETGLIYSGFATGGLLWLIHIFIQRSGRRQDASAGPQTPGQRAGPKPWAQAGLLPHPPPALMPHKHNESGWWGYISLTMGCFN